MEGTIQDDRYVAYFLVYLRAGQKLDVRMQQVDGDLQPLVGLLAIDDDTDTIERGKSESDTAAVLSYTAKTAAWY